MMKMKIKESYLVHNFINGTISPDLENKEIACSLIYHEHLTEGDYMVTRKTIEVEEVDIKHDMNMYRDKMKKKKKGDVEGEVLENENPVTVFGEVIG